MTLKETDFPLLIRFLKNLISKESDPLIIKELIIHLINLYEQVPLYPGIVNMCLNNSLKEHKPEEMLVGKRYFIQIKDDSYVGTVAEKGNKSILLKGVKIYTSEDELDLNLKEIQKVYSVNDRVLNELWSTLVFEKGVKK